MIGTSLKGVEVRHVLVCEVVEALISPASKLEIHHEVIHIFRFRIPMGGSCELRFQRNLGPTAVLGLSKWGKGLCILIANIQRHEMVISCCIVHPIVRAGLR